MNYHLFSFIIMFLIVFTIIQVKKQKNAAIIHHRKKHKNRENTEMKELAQKFIGKECLIYTIASSTEAIKGIITKITDSGLLVDCDGNLQAVNLEYVTRICEWPKNAKGKKKSVFDRVFNSCSL